jgi:hypothetical protein
MDRFQDASLDRDHNPVDVRRTWTRPEVHRLEAGDAEIGGTPDSDNGIAFS